MEKLVEAFIANPNESTRTKLQRYLKQHPMAICLATPATYKMLQVQGFKI